MISQPSAVLALAILSFILTVIWGTPLIRLMKSIKVGDNIRIELSNKIQEKAGTPTMGGVMFVLPVIQLTVMINAVSLINPEIGGRSVLLPLLTIIAFAFLGGIDDWEKLKNEVRDSHWVMVYGDYLKEGKYAARRIGVKWEDIG